MRASTDSRRRRLGGVASAALTLALAAAAPPALAAGAPGVTTGAAKSVTYDSATLTGTINPKGSATDYYFQYGPTRAYGLQTGIASVGSGTGGVGVSVPVGGLEPLTVYHYRLVGVSSAGTTIGSDRTLQTTKVPLSLQILATPSPVLWGAPVRVQGTLSGTGNGSREVVLQADTFPYTAGFANLGNPELTNAAGGFEFTLLSDTITAQFRVVTTTNPPVISPVVTEPVAVHVVSHVARARRRGYARIYGTVTPAENGAKVAMLRIAGAHGVLAGGTVLTPLNSTTSKFSRVVRVRRGVYRVLVQVSGAQVSGYGQPLLIR